MNRAGVLVVLANWMLLSGCGPPVSPRAAEAGQAQRQPDAIASGEQVYRAYCAACHGLDGKGNGPAASALRASPTDLTQLSRRNQGRFPADRVEAMARGDYEIPPHGSKEMPVWGPALLARSGTTQQEVEQNIRNLVRYIEFLQSDLVARSVLQH